VEKFGPLAQYQSQCCIERVANHRYDEQLGTVQGTGSCILSSTGRFFCVRRSQ
jgi:hypothetical protein